MRLALALFIATTALVLAIPGVHGLLFECSNGRCDPAFSRSTCNLDCSTDLDVCGDGTCTAGESQNTCPDDCTASAGTCQRDNQCSNDLTKVKVYQGTLDPSTGICTFQVVNRINCGTTQISCSADGTKVVTAITGKCQALPGDDKCKIKSSTETLCANGCAVINGIAQCSAAPPNPVPTNRAPLLASVMLTPSRAKTGIDITVNSTSNDSDAADNIVLQCGTAAGTETSFENSLNCAGAPARVNASCVFAAPAGNGDTAIYCRAFDTKNFSQPRQATLTLDNTKPRSIITGPPDGTPEKRDFTVLVTDVDNVPNGLDKCFYRIEDNGHDTTFRDTPGALDVTADNQESLLAGPECSDVTYRFSVSNAPADSTVQIFLTDIDGESQRVTGTELREITKCDGSPATASPPVSGSFAGSRGQFILSFQTDASGSGSGTITRSAEAADHGAYLYAAFAGTSSTPVGRDTFSVQDEGRELPNFWASRACNAGVRVKVGKHCSTQSTQATCRVFAKANDTAGNEGDPASASYPIAFVSSRITAPAAGSLQGTNFSITVQDEDLSGSGLKKCEYRVSSRASQTAAYQETIPWTERACNADQQIPVKTEGCKDAGTDACQVQVRAKNNNSITGPVDARTFSIDFNKPITAIDTAITGWVKQNFEVSFTDTDPSGGTLRCEYRVLSGTTNTKGWTVRQCSTPVIITVGQTGDCRNEGAGKCTIFAHSIKGSLQSDDVNQSYNILLTQVTDEDGFSSVSTAATITGVQFTAVSRTAISLPIFRICSAGATINDCANAFNQQRLNCGLGKACLCGSLTGFSCDVTCSERMLGYYALATGADGTTIVSPAKTVTCLKTAAGELDGLIAYFQALDLQLTDLINRNDFLCRTGTDEEKQLFCPFLIALQQAQALDRDHTAFLNSVKASPTPGKLQEARTRSDTVRQQIIDLMTNGLVTTVDFNVAVPGTAKLNSNVLISVTLSKNGNLNIFGKVECAVSKPTGPPQRTTSQCLNTDGGSASITFAADQLGRSNVECRLLASFRPDCSTSFEMGRKNGTIQVSRLINSTITRIEAPASAVKNSAVQVNVFAKNPDSEDAFGFASCRVREPGAAAGAPRKSSCQLIRGANQEETQLGIGFTVPKAGKWTVDGCILNISTDNDCSGSQTHATSTETKAFEVLQPTTLVITRVKLPLNPTVSRETNATATVENPLTDRYAVISCNADTPDSTRIIRSQCEFLNSGELSDVQMRFTPDVKGLWNITACTISSSNDACDTVTPHQTVSDVGNFTVVGGRQLLIEQVTAPASARTNAETSASVRINNPTDNARFGNAMCTFRRPDNTIISNSSLSCTRFNSAETKTLTVNITAGIAGTWTLQSCRVNGSTNSNCLLPVKDDEAILAQTFSVAAESLPSIASVQPPLGVLLNTEGITDVIVENNGTDKSGSATCKFSDPIGQISTSSSACVQLPGNAATTAIPVTKLFSTAGQWTVVSCSLNAGAAQDCSNAAKTDEEQVGKNFNVSIPNNLFITRAELPANILKGNIAQINISVQNPLADNRFALVSCTITTPGGQRTASNCTGVPANSQRKAELDVVADAFGTWNLSACSVKSSLNAQCTGPTDQDQRSNLGTFEVIRGTRLTAANFVVPANANIGDQTLVSADISNPSQSDLFATMRCDFRTPLNTRITNSSVCARVAGESAFNARVFVTAGTAGTWSVDSCNVLGSFNSDCSASEVHFTKSSVGQFTASSGPSPERDLSIVSARTLGDVLRGEFAKVEVIARNPADAKFALASCSFRTPSSQLRTGDSQCLRVDKNMQRQLVAQLRTDQTGAWNVTSCTLKASENPDCSQAAANDSRSNVGTFTVAPPTDLIIAQILPMDTINDSVEDVTVKIENPLTDSRFAKLSCILKRPSGTSFTVSSGCSLVSRETTKDVLVSAPVNEIGTWEVSRCSVFSSTKSDCSTGSITHTANGTTFIVSRPDRIAFTSGLSFPASVQNGSVITISSSARNPSASDIFARMRCIFIPPTAQAQNIVANSSCFVIPGETAAAVSVGLLANFVGQWTLVSCSMLGASDSQCSDQFVHATNSSGGQFTSVGAQINNLSIISSSVSSTAVRGGTADIRFVVANPNDFPQNTNMRCTIRSPSNAEENRTSECRPVNTTGTQELLLSRTVDELGTWNVTSCAVFASASGTCSNPIVQNSSQNVGAFEVVPPTNIIIKKAFGNPALNSSFTNITAVAENPLAARKFVLVSCDVRSPSGRNISRNSCTGINANEVRSVNFPVFVDEIGTWAITRCSLNASNSFDCSASESHSNATGGTFAVVRRTNITFDSVSLPQTRAFINTSIEVRSLVRNPSETDLFGNVACKFRIGSSTRQNTSACTLFRAGTVTEKSVAFAADLLGTWNAENCTVSASLSSDCSQAETHDTATNIGSVNVTIPPDLAIVDIQVPEGIAKNHTGFANLAIRNDGILTFAVGTCSFTSTAKTVTNRSSCQAIEPGSETLDVPVFVDRLGNWTVSQCSVSSSSDSSCASLRLHNTSNITRNFNGTGKTLEIEEVLRPQDDIRVGDRVEVIVRVRNVDDTQHKGFVNCTLRQPNNRTLEITSSVQTIPSNDTRLFRPSFIAELSGQWRLQSCIVYRTESPAFREDEFRVDEIFNVFLNGPPSGGGGVCSVNSECPGTDLKCYCSGGDCRACPVGTMCRSNRCENIATSQCTFDSDCPAGLKCERGTCLESRLQCTFDSDCPLGFQCSRGSCAEKAPQCTRDDQCLPGYRCTNQQCTQQQEGGTNIIVTLILIVIVALIIAVALFVVVRRKVSNKDIFEEIERAKKGG